MRIMTPALTAATRLTEVGEDVAEILHYVRVSFKVIRHVRSN